ncbi:uncharacterized protein LOC116045131 isoform X2 [Sander lucioperca]|uniref:uncharacterized protein LOC116045131 isoform X2 n=1 Tax=Sander lucioperca TaxID=283035 RepID=UPI001653C1A4|nr:uncharacterized protein LOC116045131 isoform X2 [Sander lucioperca]
MEVYEDYSHIIRKKGNTAAINKARDVAWQNIADRLNASNLSSQRRTGHQVKIKYKNILSNATRKQTASMGTGGGPPPEELTPAEILALGINNGPKIVGIEGGSSSNPVAPEIRAPYVEGIVNHCPYSGDRPSLGITNYAPVCLIVTGDQIILLDPPQVHIEDAAGTQVDPGEGPSQQPHDDDDDDDDYDDDETLTGRDSELQDEPRPSPAGKRTTSAGRSEVSSHSLLPTINCIVGCTDTLSHHRTSVQFISGISSMQRSIRGYRLRRSNLRSGRWKRILTCVTHQHNIQMFQHYYVLSHLVRDTELWF